MNNRKSDFNLASALSSLTTKSPSKTALRLPKALYLGSLERLVNVYIRADLKTLKPAVILPQIQTISHADRIALAVRFAEVLSARHDSVISYDDLLTQMAAEIQSECRVDVAKLW